MFFLNLARMLNSSSDSGVLDSAASSPINVGYSLLEHRIFSINSPKSHLYSCLSLLKGYQYINIPVFPVWELHAAHKIFRSQQQECLAQLTQKEDAAQILNPHIRILN